MDVLIPVVFPDYKIAAFGRKWEDLGHAGILFVLGRTGTTRYFEYGRYDRAGHGMVRKRTVPDARVDEATQALERGSLRTVLHAIAKQSGQGTRLCGAYIEQAHAYPRALDYVEGRRKLNTQASRPGYDLLSNNCGTFMQRTLDAAGVDTPWMLDPRPNSYIQELRDDFVDLDYDPRTGVLAIGD